MFCFFVLQGKGLSKWPRHGAFGRQHTALPCFQGPGPGKTARARARTKAHPKALLCQIICKARHQPAPRAFMSKLLLGLHRGQAGLAAPHRISACGGRQAALKAGGPNTGQSPVLHCTGVGIKLSRACAPPSPSSRPRASRSATSPREGSVSRQNPAGAGGWGSLPPGARPKRQAPAQAASPGAARPVPCAARAPSASPAAGPAPPGRPGPPAVPPPPHRQCKRLRTLPPVKTPAGSRQARQRRRSAPPGCRPWGRPPGRPGTAARPQALYGADHSAFTSSL